MPIQIMAIINTSPDSFAGDGLNVDNKAALRARLQAALDEGADILDIGGQSTRPGAAIISEDEEIKRVVPAITLARQLTDKPISVDTFKPAVAKAALGAGATIVNDISGCGDPGMIRLVQETGAEVVVMHMRGTPKTMSQLTHYPKGVVQEVKTFLQQRTHALQASGVSPGKIIVDPGIGFAKTAEQCLELTYNLRGFTKLGFRVLYGASQKSFIGKVLAEKKDTVAPLEERAVGTAVVQSFAMMHGAAIVRVHDVRSAVQTRTLVTALKAASTSPTPHQR